MRPRNLGARLALCAVRGNAAGSPQSDAGRDRTDPKSVIVRL